MRITATLALSLTLASFATASAAPTPVPGGANQAEGVATIFGKPSFNGEVRLTPRTLRDATASDGFTAPSGQKWLVFQATGANGTNKPLDMQQFVASIVNADGESYAAQPDKLLPMGGVYGIAPGAGWREQVAFQVPADFVPAKIVLLPANKKHAAFRIAVGPNEYHTATAAR